MKTLSVFFLLLLFPGICSESPKVRKESFVSHQKKRTYYLVLPENLKSSEPAPLVVLFHGSGRDGLSMVDQWKELAEKEGFIIVGPNSADPSSWNTVNDGPSVIHDLVELLKTKYPIDPRRVYLFGHSGGAVYAILLSLMESKYFAATAIHAGALREKAEFKFLDRATGSLPLAIWIGTKDPFFSLSAVKATRDALMQKGWPVEVTEMPEHDHWYYDLAPKINLSAWEFLRKYKLEVDPQFVDVDETPASTGDGGKAIADANKALAEIASTRDKINSLLTGVNSKEFAINAKDFGTERVEISRLAGEEADLLGQAATLSRSLAEKASQVNSPQLEEKYQQYFDLIAQYNRTYAELLDVMQEQARAVLGSESFEVINAKRAAAQKKIEALRAQADELLRKSEAAIH